MSLSVAGVARRSLSAAWLKQQRGQVTIGEQCRIPLRSITVKVKRLTVGDYVRFGEGLTLQGESFTFGDHFFCGTGVSITGHGATFSVGRFSSFGERVAFLLGQGNHRPQSLANFPFGHVPQFDGPHWARGFDYAGESATYARVGHDVWIGIGSVVLPNVTIGHGAIVAASSVVKHDVPPYAIVGGNPAQVIAFRFKQRLIKELLELQWWDWPIERINRNKALFTTNLMARASLTGLARVD